METPTNACACGGYDLKRLSGRMKEVVMLAIFGATVGGRAQADGEKTIGDQEKEEKAKAKICSSVFVN